MCLLVVSFWFMSWNQVSRASKFRFCLSSCKGSGAVPVTGVHVGWCSHWTGSSMRQNISVSLTTVCPSAWRVSSSCSTSILWKNEKGNIIWTILYLSFGIQMKETAPSSGNLWQREAFSGEHSPTGDQINLGNWQLRKIVTNERELLTSCEQGCRGTGCAKTETREQERDCLQMGRWHRDRTLFSRKQNGSPHGPTSRSHLH